MSLSLPVVLLSAAISSWAAASDAADIPGPSLALFAIDAPRQLTFSITAFSIKIRERLGACGRFQLIEQGKADRFHAIKGFGRSFSAPTMARFGRGLGADLVMVGRVFAHQRGGWRVTLSVVRSATGKAEADIKDFCDGCAPENAGIAEAIARRLAEKIVERHYGAGQRLCPDQ